MNSRLHKSQSTIFIDRNSGGRTIHELIEAVGIKVVLHSDVFAVDKGDHEWLKFISEKRWIGVTGDQALSRSLLFLQQLNRCETNVFILYALNGSSPQERARIIIGLYAWMVSTSKGEGPSLWRVARHGKSRVDIAAALGRAKKRLQNSGQPRSAI